MFDISPLTVLIGSIVLIVLGLVIAYRGLHLLKNFVRTTGAILMGLILFLVGGTIGLLFSPLFAIIGAIGGGILGLIIGFILAPTLLWLLLSIIVFMICFNIGSSIADTLTDTQVVILIAGFIAGLIGSWTFSLVAKRMLAGAASTAGGLMVGSGIFLILLNYVDTSLLIASIGGLVGLIVVASTGYGANRPKKHKKRKKDH
jgi:hypothetical protein